METPTRTPDGIRIVTMRARVIEVCCDCGREFTALRERNIACPKPRCVECAFIHLQHERDTADGLLVTYARYLGAPVP